MTIDPNRSPQKIRAKYAQRSQRYQKITLLSPNSSITFSRVGFELIRSKATAKSSFTCSNELLNRIWRDGVKTVDMCTVARDETAPAWEVTESGTQVHGQHWAPCRRGTRWGDKRICFQVHIEAGGASWAVHMVANGLIFCLDAAEKVLYACEGLSHESTIFPVAEKGRWLLGDLPLDGWIVIETITRDDTVSVSIQNRQIAFITNLDIRPLLGGSFNNTGSIAFGGPYGWVARYRHLMVHSPDNVVLYENDMLLTSRDRTLADFQVGTNKLACTIDGAKRDRACFGGDLYVMGRSITHSTMDFAAIKGSIELLTSHQTKDGYLGNLCPIQAPIHDSDEEPPTYAFYSLTYALLLVVAIKDYWMHTGDEGTRLACSRALERLMEFSGRFVNQDGILVAPPPLSMHWFPLGGPVFGTSCSLNVAYYEALLAMALVSDNATSSKKYVVEAQALKSNIQEHFFDRSSGILRLSDSLPREGICQSTSAHAMTLNLTPPHPKDLHHLTGSDESLPLAFRDLAHWSSAEVVSPYATGFAVEALFSRGDGSSAVNLLKRVWGLMADKTNPNYSGGHWESLRTDGSPHSHDTSLMHGWSTWPVFLMPRYLAGLYPIEAGWKVFGVEPVLVGLERVECIMATVAGTIKVELSFDEKAGHGAIRILAPHGTKARLKPPQGWVLHDSILVQEAGAWEEHFLSKKNVGAEANPQITQIRCNTVNLASKVGSVWN